MPADTSDKFRPLVDEIVTLVEKHFYDSIKVSDLKWKNRAKQLQQYGDTATSADQLADSINALPGILETSHTHYFPKSDPKRYQLLGVFSTLYDQNREDLFIYEGIGIDTRRVDGRYVIISVFDGFPAKKAGLRFGDTITAVDGKTFHPIRSFREKTGKTVRIKVDRHGGTTEIRVKVTKIDGRTMFMKAAEASIRSIDHRGKRIGYIHLWSYTGSQYHELVNPEITEKSGSIFYRLLLFNCSYLCYPPFH